MVQSTSLLQNSFQRMVLSLKKPIAILCLTTLVGANVQFEIQKFAAPAYADAQSASQCDDGMDNDHDGYYDMQDAGCSDPMDNDESNGGSNNNTNNNDPNQNQNQNVAAATQCNDGMDNDHDGDTDFPNDMGCASPMDNDEYNAPAATECNDGSDNDHDNLVDMQDPGCTSPSDNSEYNAPAPTECNDGADNDHDNLVDMQDPGCTSPNDNSEYNAPVSSTPAPTECNDNADNDHDNLVDMQDPGCTSPNDNSEYNAPVSSTPAPTQCNDGADNDHDLYVDFPNDPGCSSLLDNDEYNPIVSSSSTPATTECNDHADNDHDNLVDMLDPGCTSPNDNSEYNAPASSTPTITQCNDGADNDHDLYVDFPNDIGCSSPLDNDEYNPIVSSSSTPASSSTPTITQCNDGADNDHDLYVDFPNDIGCSSPLDNDEYNPIVSSSSTPASSSSSIRFQCNDGADNDHDLYVDFPNDPGCSSPTDNDEYNPPVSSSSSTPTLYQCNDGADNDHDLYVDFPNDPGCSSPTDNDEYNPPVSSSSTPNNTADLRIIKTGASVALHGTTFGYTISVTNSGPATAQNVVVRDPFPTGLVFNASASDGRCALQNGNTVVVCTLGTMAVGTQTVSLSFSVPSVPVCTQQNITNTATVESSTSDTNTSNNISSWSTTLTCPITSSSSSSTSTSSSTSSVPQNTDMTVQKTGSVSAIFGQDLVYTITARNNGTVAATNVNIVDPVPAGLTFKQNLSTSGCLQQGASVYCNLGTIQAGAVRTITLAFGTTVPAACQNAQVMNTAFVTNDNNSNASNDTSTFYTVMTCPTVSSSSSTTSSTSSVNGNTDMTVRKVGPISVIAGQDISYTITARNNGTVAATNVNIVDPVPAGLTFKQNLSTNGCLQQGASVYCNLGTVAGNATASVTLVFGTTAPALCQNGTIMNTAFVTNDNNSNASNDTSTAYTQITCGSSSSSSSTDTSADVSFTKVVQGSTTVAPQSMVRYSLAAHNNGPATAQNVVITDTIPANLTFMPISSDPSCTVQGNVVSCAVGTIAPNQTVTKGLAFFVAVTAPCNSVIVNNGSVTTSNDPNTGNNQASAQVSVQCGSSSSSSSTPTIITDLAITKTANPTVVNVGDTTAFTITVTNNGPSVAENVKVIDIITNGLSYQNSFASYGSYANGQWTIGTLAVGSTVSLQIVARVDIPGTLSNTATVSTTTAESNYANNSATATVTGIQQAQTGCIDILKQTYAANGNPFSTITPFIFNLDGNAMSTVNDSSGHARFLSVPVGVHNVSEVMINGWTQMSVFPQNGQVTVFASADNSNCSNVTFQNKLNAVSSSSSSSSTPSNYADVAITKTANPQTVSVGSTTVFTITVTNNGPATAQNVVMNDTLPSGLNYVSSVTTIGSFVGNQWQIGTLNAGASVTMQMTATVNVNGSVTNTATVTSTTQDSNTGNNTASATVNGTQQNGCIDIYKTATDVNGNQIYSVPSFTFSLDNNRTVTNDTAGRAHFDNVPAGTHTVTEYSQNNWNMTSISPANGNVTVTAGSTCATVYVRNRQTNDDNRNDFTISKSDGRSTVHPGDRLVYTITVRNNSGTNRNNVTVRDTLPNDLNFRSASDGGRLNGRIVTWNNVYIAAYGTRTFVLTAEVDDDARNGNLTNRAEVNGRVAYDTDHVDEDRNNNDELELTKDASTSEVFPGGMIEYTVRIRNNSNETMRNIRVVDDLPSNITIIDDGDSDSRNTDRLEWRIGSLARNASRVIRYRISVNNSYRAGQFVRNDVEATADDGQTEHASALVQVIGAGNLPQTGFELGGSVLDLHPITGNSSDSASLPLMFWLALAGLTTGTGAGFLRKFVTGI